MREAAEARRYASPPLIDYRSFTAEEFQNGLGQMCSGLTDPDEVCMSFLDFCAEILSRQRVPTVVDTLFPGYEMAWNLRSIPRPFRELMAVYQAWGLFSMGGVEKYLESSNFLIDWEADRGLKLLGQNQVVGVLSRARMARWRYCFRDLPDHVDDHYWARFFDALGGEAFETRLARKLMSVLARIELEGAP